MIHKLDDGSGYVISSQHMWMPGLYDSKRSANYAFRFPDKSLIRLRDSITGPITFEMLQKERKRLNNA